MSCLFRFGLACGGMIGAAFLPIVPIRAAPVVPHRVYRLTFTSTVDTLATFVFPRPGMSYEWEWYTPLVMLLALAVGAAIGIGIVEVIIRARRVQ